MPRCSAAQERWEMRFTAHNAYPDVLCLRKSAGTVPLLLPCVGGLQRRDSRPALFPSTHSSCIWPPEACVGLVYPFALEVVDCKPRPPKLAHPKGFVRHGPPSLGGPTEPFTTASVPAQAGDRGLPAPPSLLPAAWLLLHARCQSIPPSLPRQRSAHSLSFLVPPAPRRPPDKPTPPSPLPLHSRSLPLIPTPTVLPFAFAIAGGESNASTLTPSFASRLGTCDGDTGPRPNRRSANSTPFDSPPISADPAAYRQFIWLRPPRRPASEPGSLDSVARFDLRPPLTTRPTLRKPEKREKKSSTSPRGER
jgi:hypothetical protein